MIAESLKALDSPGPLVCGASPSGEVAYLAVHGAGNNCCSTLCRGVDGVFEAQHGLAAEFGVIADQAQSVNEDSADGAFQIVRCESLSDAGGIEACGPEKR